MPRTVELIQQNRPVVNVLVGLVEDPQGRILINQRRRGTHRAGEWEFPGGKRRGGETPLDALRRELDEELGIEVLEAARFLRLEHDYGDRLVRLDVWRIRRYGGEPYAREGQPLRWIAPQQLEGVALLAADRPIVEALLQGD